MRCRASNNSKPSWTHAATTERESGGGKETWRAVRLPSVQDTTTNGCFTPAAATISLGEKVTLFTDQQHHPQLVPPPGRADHWTPLILRHTRCGQDQQAVHVYLAMRRHHQGGTDPPDPRTLVTVLKACARTRDLRALRRVHADLTAGDGYAALLGDPRVTAALVDAFARCGSFPAARAVWDAAPAEARRDPNAWATMVGRCVAAGEHGEALAVYARVRREGVPPSGRACVLALKACCSHMVVAGGGGHEEGQAAVEEVVGVVESIHRDVAVLRQQQQEEKGNVVVVVETALVDTYAKCGRVDRARAVFDGVPVERRDVVCWNAMIAGYAGAGGAGAAREAVRVYERMVSAGGVPRPNARTYVAALEACGTLAAAAVRAGDGGGEGRRREVEEVVRGIHARVEEVCRAEEDAVVVVVQTALVDAYAKCGRVDAAQEVFERMTRRDAAAWTAMMLGLVAAPGGSGEAALRMYWRMRREGVACDAQVHVAALKACGCCCGSSSSADEGECLEWVAAIDRDVQAAGFDRDPASSAFVITALVDAYANCGSIRAARAVFDRAPRRAVGVWNAMVAAYANEEDEWAEAVELYNRMRRDGVAPNARTFVAVLKACSSSSSDAAASVVRGVHAASAAMPKHKKTNSLDDDDDDDDDDDALFVATALVDAYAKCVRDPHAARAAFDAIPVNRRDAAAWNAMILGYLHLDKPRHALLLYDHMQQMLHSSTPTTTAAPTSRTVVGALCACGRLQSLARGRQIHSILRNDHHHLQFAVDPYVTTSLIDMYAKCGALASAQSVFDAAPAAARGVAAWNALIAAHARYGDADAGFALVARMEAEEVRPDAVTFLALLTACSHSSSSAAADGAAGGLDRALDRAVGCVRGMSGHGLAPGLKHWTCLVDLLARAGRIAAAEALVRALPCPPDAAVWDCLMSACRKWGAVGGGGGDGDYSHLLGGSVAAAVVDHDDDSGVNDEGDWGQEQRLLNSDLVRKMKDDDGGEPTLVHSVTGACHVHHCPVTTPSTVPVRAASFLLTAP